MVIMNPRIDATNFDERPFIAIWEVTQACDLACVHCRASAQPDRNPFELSTAEGKQLIDQISALKITLWSVFFLVPTGRGKLGDLLNGEEFEQVFEKLYGLSKTASFDLKTTEAQHYRRYLLQQRVLERKTGIVESTAQRPALDLIGRAPRGLNDGKGFVFISHTGEVFPSGFLPKAAGNIRQQTLATLYCDSPIFRDLRNTSMLAGKCGACEFKEICGGSRSRAFALTGDLLAEEPCCVYMPKGYDKSSTLTTGAPALQVLY
jgi:radical SAM protein with 4Fe4S-binding SPASM domain